MVLIYKLGIQLFSLLIRILAPFHSKAALLRKGRKESLEKMGEAFPDSNISVAWFHCASLGEFEQARPLIESFKIHFPQYKILLTFFSPSGYEIRKNYPLADCIAYLPSDTLLHAQNLISIVRPKVAFFIKYEFWHYYFRCLKAHNIPIFSVSAIFRPHQVFFKPYGTFFRITLHCVTHFFVQNQSSKELLASIGLQNTSVTGDTRFDRVKTIYDSKKSVPLAERFKNNSSTIVVGSSWKEDIDILSAACKNFSKHVKLIIAPHEISESSVRYIEEKFAPRRVVRYSRAENVQELETYDILVIDNIGMLSSLYQYGDVAYVGGAFGKGLHNILEAAVYGIPVVFGKKYHKFQEAKDLVAQQGAFSVRNANELNTLLEKLFQQASYREHAGKITRQYVTQHTGATQRIIDFLTASGKV